MYLSLPEKGWDTSSKEKKDVKRLGGKDRLTDAQNRYPSELFRHCFASKRWGH